MSVFLRAVLSLILISMVAACAAQTESGERVYDKTPSQLNADPEYYYGKLVRVEGVLSIGQERTGLYSTLEAYYGFSPSDTSIGVEMPDYIDAASEWYNRSYVTVTGRFQDNCPQNNEQPYRDVKTLSIVLKAQGEEVETVTVCVGALGEGEIAGDVEITFHSWPWQRLKASEIDPENWELDSVTADPAYQPLKEVAEKWFAALQEYDAKAMLSLVANFDPDFDRRRFDQQSIIYFGAMGKFQIIQHYEIEANFELLRERHQGSKKREDVAVCFCLKKDCSNDWPSQILDWGSFMGNPFPYLCESFVQIRGRWYWKF